METKTFFKEMYSNEKNKSKTIRKSDVCEAIKSNHNYIRNGEVTLVEELDKLYEEKGW